MNKINRIALFCIPALLLTLVTTAQNIEFIPPTTLSDLQEADSGSMDLGDIDQDGDMDLVIIGFSSSQGTKTSIYLNDGTGFFVELENEELINTSSGEARFVDVDNDNVLDLIIVAANSSPYSTASLYRNDGTGNFTLESDSGLRGSKSGDFDFGDVDGDGDVDLVISGQEFYFDGGVGAIDILFTRLFLNDGTGHFEEQMNSPFEAVIESDLGFVDLDNDNDLDLILTGKNEDDLSSTTVYSNDGLGNYSEILDHPFDDVKGDLSIADSDDDGDQDVMIHGAGNDSEDINKLFINDGSGNYTEHPTFDVPDFQGAADFADLDNDGDQDILLFGLADQGIIGHIYENEGANEYMLADTMYGSYISSVRPGDIDGDNDIDFLVSGSSFDPLYPTTRTVRVFFNNLDSVTSVEESTLDQLVIYPNPSRNLIQIDAQAQLDEILIYDVLGQLVLRETNYSPNSPVDIEALKPGSYIIYLRNDQEIGSIRLVKE